MVKYIRTTPQRREEFEDIVRGELQRQKDRIAGTALPDEEAEFVSKRAISGYPGQRNEVELGLLHDQTSISP